MTYFLTITLLVCSNVFMTLAWYGHLRFMNRSLVGRIGELGRCVL